jgi:hypothetical protein
LVGTPSQEQAEALGIREWPQQAFTKGTFQETVNEGKTLVRYILDGKVKCQVSGSEEEKQVAMAPGTLLEVKGKATLDGK